MSTSRINVGSKQLLAKLMAEENISVIHRQGSKTAMFDGNKRVLVLPIWKDMEGYTYNHLIGHEVGHALFSIPVISQGMDDAIAYIDNSQRNLVKNFLNVCEDARIEKLMLQKYPGLTMDFRNSYKKIMDDNIFGTKGKDLTTLPLSDRVNLQCKLGSLIDLPFNEEEQKILDEIQAAYTWDQTVIATKKLYDYCSEMANQSNDESQGDDSSSQKKNKKKGKDKNQEDYEDSGSLPEEKKENDSEDESDESDEGGEDGEESDEDGEGDESSDQDGDESDGKESDGDSDESGGDSGDGKSKKNKNGKNKGEDSSGDSDGQDSEGTEEVSKSPVSGNKSSKGRQGGGQERVAPSCDTQQMFEDNSDALLDKNAKNVEYFTIPKAILPKLIVPYSKVIPNITKFYSTTKNGLDGKAAYEKFRSENKPYIDYMVQQFNLKKAADDSQRATIAKTGMIDVAQLYSYRFNEDLFRRSTILPGEKNHALVMFVDFSGSMIDHMNGTIEQLLNTAMYCRKLNIPFEAYSFGASGTYNNDTCWEAKENDFNITGFKLRQYFGIGMSQALFYEACVALYTMSMQYKSDAGYYGTVPAEESLGGTPLNESIVASFTIVENIIAKTKAEIVTVAVITDGEGSYLSSKVNAPYGYNTDNILRDPVTKMEWRMNNSNQTEVLLEALRYRLKVNAVGFYICSGNASTVKGVASRMNSRYGNSKVSEDIINREFENNHFYSIKNAGYEEYFVIAGGKAISTAGNTTALTGETADFINRAKLKAKKRIVLGRFVEIMAKKGVSVTK